MRLPDVLRSLTDQGVIDEVVRPLKSGKEAQVYLVRSDGEARVAKVYKDADQRSFKQRAQYTEGRRTRNTRDQRAIQRRTRHGKAQEEEAWKSAEVNIIYRLHAAGVRVPTPYNFIDGVLIMELVRGHDGHPAPRLSELSLDTKTAHTIYQQLVREVVKMLCAGIVHGDLSDYNVLVDEVGPVVIDFPQSVDASQNRNARKLLVRDVDNLNAFLARVVPGARRRPFGQEIWKAYEDNRLTPDYELTGRFRRSEAPTNMTSLLDEIEDADNDERRRREALGQAGPRPRKREVIIKPIGGSKPARGSERGSRGRGPGRDHRGQGGQRSASGEGAKRDASGTANNAEGAPKRRRRRRKRGGGSGQGSGQGSQQNERGAQQARGGGTRSDTNRSDTNRSDTNRSGSQRSDANRSNTDRSSTDRSSTERSVPKRAEASAAPREGSSQAAGDAAKPRRRRRRRRRRGPNEGGDAKGPERPRGEGTS